MTATVKEPVLVTEAAGEPITLAEALKYLKLDHNRDDDEIGRLITAAREEAEEFTGRKFLTATYRQDLDEFPAGLTPEDRSIELVPVPLASVTSITYYDSDDVQQTLAASVYEADTVAKPGVVRLKEGQTWPATKYRANAVAVNYTAGYGTLSSSVPQAIKLAIKSIVRTYYDQTGDDQVARGLERGGIAWRLLRPFRMNMIARA